MTDDQTPRRSDSQRLTLLKQHQEALLELARSREQAEDLAVSLHVITESAAKTLDLERTSVWLFDVERTKIVCRDLYLRPSGFHSNGNELLAHDYPSYFRALELNRALAADDCYLDERTSELAENYLKPHGITSLLDAPIRQGGVTVGIACHEHVGPARTWTIEDQNFAGSIADMCALSLERSERQHAEEEVRRRDALLEGVAKAANRMFADTEREIGSRDAKLAVLADLGGRLLMASDAMMVLEPLLGVIGSALDASRISLYAQHPHIYTGELVTSERGRWAPDSSGSMLDADVRWDERGLERWREEFEAGRTVAAIINTLPDSERPAFEIRFVRSVLAVPIVRSDGLWGYLEIWDQNVERDWTAAERSFASAAVEMLGIALAS